MATDRQPPQALDAEQCVLGSILLSNDAIGKVSLILSAPDFYDGRHRAVYEGCCALYVRGEAINQITLAAELERMGRLKDVGVAYLSDLINAVPTSLHADFYAKEVRQCAVMRRLIQAGAKIVQNAYENKAGVADALTQAEGLISALRETKDSRGLVPMREIVDAYFEEVRQREGEGAAARVRVPTGLNDLDRKLGGFHPTDLVIIAARPGQGKTSLLVNIAEHAAIGKGLRIALFSLEMSREQLLERLLASRAWVDSQHLRLGELSEWEQAQLRQAAYELAKAPIWIDDSATLTVTELRSKARLVHGQHKLDLVMVDYLQLMDGENRRGENRAQELGRVSKGLKALAKELRVPVLAAAQLNRAIEHRTPAKPMLSDLRDSGGFEQDADVVMFLYREQDASEENRVLEIAKHRNGPTGQLGLKFVGKYTRFHAIDDKLIPPEERKEAEPWTLPF